MRSHRCKWMANQSNNPALPRLFVSLLRKKYSFTCTYPCMGHMHDECAKCSNDDLNGTKYKVYSVQKSHQICITFLKLILPTFHGNYDIDNMHRYVIIICMQYICYGVWSAESVITFHNLRLGFFSWIQIFVYWTRILTELKNYTESKPPPASAFHWHENKERVNAYCFCFLSFNL